MSPDQRRKREQAAIVRVLRRLGARVWALGARGRRLGCLPHVIASLPPADPSVRVPTSEGEYLEVCRRLEVLVKARGGRLSPAQQLYRHHARVCGVTYIVGGLDDVVAWLLGDGFLRLDQVPRSRLRRR